MSRFEATVVIPAFAEERYLPNTLASLNQSFQKAGGKSAFSVVVIVNEPTNAKREDHENNLRTLQWLERNKKAFDFRLCVPNPQSFVLAHGVGEARKLGMEWAAKHISTSDTSRLICLDADCSVEETYVSVATNDEFSGSGFTFQFDHLPDETDSGIRVYQDYLGYMVEGLEHAQSPYAHWTIGSCLGTSRIKYFASGGMPAKNATEDFHFMNKLRKLGTIDQMPSTVYPSARISHRVYLGTGFFQGQYAKDPEKAFFSLFIPHPNTFLRLKDFLCDLVDFFENQASIQIKWKTHQALEDFLLNQNFLKKLQSMKRHSSSKKSFEKRIHQLFDGLQTFRFLKLLNGDQHPKTIDTFYAWKNALNTMRTSPNDRF